ncbi:MAG: lytic transglycosylase domain-containing protein [Rhodospirillaceae bacterium]|nr:MAG: lytic transglycosylase domain-containing protein [Rhodospirillaceae bacterium]
MHEPPGARKDLRYRFPRSVTILALALAVLLAAPAMPRAQTPEAPPAPAPAAPEAPQKNAPAHAKKHGGKKSAHHAPKSAKPKPGKAKEGKTKPGGGKKKPLPPLPASARAPALPRREPITLTAKDREAFAEAMKAVSAHAWPHAQAAVARTDNPILKKVVDWSYMREPGAHVPFADRVAFITNNPGWPGLKELQRRTEEALDDPITVTVPAALVAWFNDHPPLTTAGQVGYARALQTVGETDKAAQIARQAWITGSFDRSTERAFLDTFGGLLTPGDHRQRLDNLLYDEDTAEAERMFPRVDTATAATAKARISLITSTGNVDALLRAVPPEFAGDPGLLYDRIKWRRRHDQDDAARALLPQEPDRGPRADLMWKEREALAEDALDNGLITEAYNIVKNHGELTAATGLADAEWMAGWISLRFLKDGEMALPHFEKVYDTVQMPANLARGAYWTGRAAASLGRADIAADWYRRAAIYVTTYYGQLALARLHDDPLPALSDDPVPTADDRADFEARELTQAMRALADVGDTTYLRAFILALAESSDDATDRLMAAEIADRLGHPDWGVTLARQAGRSNITLLTYGFPVPAYQVPTEPERAFILAITRQESNFDPNARSGAGAMGLMQLMPLTAKAMAKSNGVKFSGPKLIADPAYNLRLGALYLKTLVNSFGGSYLLAAAAYNAGPGRVHQWMREFGDPRDGQTDPIDWVEKIPFGETRAYVQRVLENMMIYRARLAKTRAIGQTLETELARPGVKPPDDTPG